MPQCNRGLDIQASNYYFASYNREGGRDGQFTTLELKMNFLKPVWSGRLTATGRVVKGGRTVGLVECDVVDEKDGLVARASRTCTTLRGAQAEGR